MTGTRGEPNRDGRGPWHPRRLIGAAGVCALGGVAGWIAGARRGDRAVRRSNRRFELAAEAVQALIYDVDLATGQVVRSAGLKDLVGFAPAEAPRTTTWWQERIHPDDLPSLLDERYPERTDPWLRSVEYRVRHRDGHWVHVWDRSIRLFSRAGAPVRIVGSTVDITGRTVARQRAARLLQIATALSRALTTREIVDAVLEVAIPAVGAQGGSVTLANDDGLSFETAGAAGHPEGLLSRWRRPSRAGSYPLAEAARSREPVWIHREADWAARFPDTLPDFRESGFRAVASLPLFFEDRLLGGIAFDFTEEREFPADEREFMQAVADQCSLALDRARLFDAERRARAAMAEAERRYRTLFDGSADAILAFDHVGRPVEANRAAWALLRLDAATDPLPTFAELVELPAISAEQTWADILSQGAWQAEHDVRPRNGDTVPVETRSDVIGDGADALVLVAMRDISARRDMERAQQSFLASVSHDLKSPLAGIDIQAQFLRRKAAKGQPLAVDELANRVGTMLASTRRMEELIDELVDIAQIRLGHTLQLALAQMDLTELARAAIAEHQEQTERHRIVLVADGPIGGRWDGVRLRRVLDNLLGNAIKYSPRGGDIRVEIERRTSLGREWVVVAVSDRGIGIPAADLPHVFESFRRGTNVGGRAVGHGIGLAGTRQIVEQHGGTISVHSVVGEGSRFEVVLPLTGAAHPHADDPPGWEHAPARLLAHGVHESATGVDVPGTAGHPTSPTSF